MNATVPTTGRKRRCQTGVLASDITREQLVQWFHLPTHKACKILGISLSVFKRVCRIHGIDRWPYRPRSAPSTSLLPALGPPAPSPTQPSTPISVLPTHSSGNGRKTPPPPPPAAYPPRLRPVGELHTQGACSLSDPLQNEGCGAQAAPSGLSALLEAAAAMEPPHAQQQRWEGAHVAQTGLHSPTGNTMEPSPRQLLPARVPPAAGWDPQSRGLEAVQLLRAYLEENGPAQRAQQRASPQHQQQWRREEEEEVQGGPLYASGYAHAFHTLARQQQHEASPPVLAGPPAARLQSMSQGSQLLNMAAPWEQGQLPSGASPRRQFLPELAPPSLAPLHPAHAPKGKALGQPELSLDPMEGITPSGMAGPPGCTATMPPSPTFAFPPSYTPPAACLGSTPDWHTVHNAQAGTDLRAGACLPPSATPAPAPCGGPASPFSCPAPAATAHTTIWLPRSVHSGENMLVEVQERAASPTALHPLQGAMRLAGSPSPHAPPVATARRSQGLTLPGEGSGSADSSSSSSTGLPAAASQPDGGPPKGLAGHAVALLHMVQQVVDFVQSQPNHPAAAQLTASMCAAVHALACAHQARSPATQEQEEEGGGGPPQAAAPAAAAATQRPHDQGIAERPAQAQLQQQLPPPHHQQRQQDRERLGPREGPHPDRRERQRLAWLCLQKYAARKGYTIERVERVPRHV